MDLGRTNLNDSNQNRLYIILTVVLVILSIAGIILFFLIKKNSSPEITLTQTPTEAPIVTAIPTSLPTQIPSPVVTKTATPSAKATASATIKPTATPKLSPSPTATATPTIATTSAGLVNFEKTTDGFSVTYSSFRTLYQDTEASGNRYTFYSPKGNFAVHAGSKDWSWVYPDRQFNSNLLISDKPTFRYDIATQTIVDVENNSIKYTIQCIHNGNTTLKAECEEFIKSFKLL